MAAAVVVVVVLGTKEEEKEEEEEEEAEEEEVDESGLLGVVPLPSSSWRSTAASVSACDTLGEVTDIGPVRPVNKEAGIYLGFSPPRMFVINICIMSGWFAGATCYDDGMK